jgi:hypothetical protein
MALLLGAFVALAGAGTASAALPDGRAYELVTPGADKGGGEVAARFMQLSQDGERMAYTVNGVFGDDATHAMTATGVGTTYVASRGAGGWSSRFRSNVPVPSFVSQNLFDLAFLGGPADLSRVFLGVSYDASTGLDTGVWADDAGQGGLLAAKATSPSAPRFVGSSADGEHVVIWTHRRGALGPVPGNPSMIGALLYDVSGGEARLVNVTDTGNVLNTAGGTFGAVTGANGNSGGTITTIPNAISADGSRIFFISKSPGAVVADPVHLYVRIDGQTNVRISSSVHSDPQPATTAVTFAGATSDGTRAYFTTTGRLTDDATSAGPFLYQYELPRGATSGTLSLVAGVDHPVTTTTGGWAVPQVSVSDDGSRVYFASPDDGGTFFVYDTASRETTVVARGVGATRLQSVMDANGSMLEFADISPDGRHLTFVTSSDLVPEDTYAGRQIYAYDAEEGELRLVSKGASAPASFDAAFINDDGDIAYNYNQTIVPDANFVSDDGRYVFFQTTAPLVPEDNNDVTDVYRESDGEVELLTDGSALLSSYLVGANADGSSVMFLTQNDLLPQDGDDNWDVYAARIGGGFPLPPVRAPCVADACQPTPTPTPFLPVPATGSFNGPGNVEDPETADATFSVKKVSAAAKRTLARKGRVTIVVRTSDAGMVAAKLSARLGKRWAGVDTAVARTGKPGSVRLRLALTPKAKRYLRTHRRGMSVRVDVTYSASDEGRRAAFVIRRAASKRGAR